MVREKFGRMRWGWLVVLALGVLLPRPGGAHVVSNWDWHLVDGKKKRNLHWCLVSELREGFPPDSFPRDQAEQWKKWAKEAFDNWVKDGKGKPTGWTFEEVNQLDPNCQVLIRFSTRPNGSYGKAVVPSGEKGDQRAKKVPIIIHGVDAKGNPREYGRKGKDTLDPVRILKHEIGHAIRLDDTENAEDIMGSGVETEAGEIGKHDTTPSDEDYREARDSAEGELKVAMGPPSAGEDVGTMVATLPPGPMVDAYIAMAVDAHDRYGDLDAAHDWLARALELAPGHPIATRLLDQVKAVEQQVGLQRAGVALGTLQQMMIRQYLEEERRMEHEEPHGEEHPPPEEDH
jgi:hypothetical protein